MMGLYGISDHPKGIEGWISYLHKDDSSRVVTEFEKCIHNPNVKFDTEFRIVLPDGKVKFMRANGTVLRDLDENPVRMIGLNIDITEKRKEELRRQRLEIEVQHAQKLESLGSLAGGVAHDMNNVLTAIIGISDTLLYRNQENEVIANPLQTVIKAANRGRDLVKSLINFARKDIASVQILDLNQIILGEEAILKRTTLQKIQLSTDLFPDLPKIKGDPSAITSAIMNLCINSIDAMPEGGTLKISTKYVDKMVEICIEDTGEGMTQEVLDRAIEPFFTTKPFGKGTGLGLAMVYGTMNAHHGRMDISSKVGEGTKITLYFPAVVDEPILSNVPQAEKTIKKTPSMNILLVDDDELIRKTLPEMMEIYGHKVTTVESGIRALEVLREENQIDLVILDMNMPFMGGLETLTKLREFSSVLVLVSTGFLDPSVESVLKLDPRTDYINKPFSLMELRKSINRILERNPQPGKD
jgi:signal transduction histidine kinase/ActR/RegA family two-component response regulator